MYETDTKISIKRLNDILELVFQKNKGNKCRNRGVKHKKIRRSSKIMEITSKR